MTKRELIEFLTPFDDEIHIVGGPSGRETLMAKYQMSPNGVGTVLLQVTPQPAVEPDEDKQCSAQNCEAVIGGAVCDTCEHL